MRKHAMWEFLAHTIVHRSQHTETDILLCYYDDIYFKIQNSQILKFKFTPTGHLAIAKYDYYNDDPRAYPLSQIQFPAKSPNHS